MAGGKGSTTPGRQSCDPRSAPIFFLISKLFWLVAAPSTVLLCFVTIGAVLLAAGRTRAGRVFALLGAAGLLVGGVLPSGALLLRPIEDRFPRPGVDLAPPTGVIVLGGSTDERLALARGRVTIVDAADRLTEAVILARRFPEARLVFTGGSGVLGGTELSEAADVHRLWLDMGIPDSRITVEDRSRNTDENVRFTQTIVGPEPGQRWLLVTSAFHMARAVALFRANGWPVIPDPVDYRTRGDAADWRPSLNVVGNLQRLDLAVREWVGLVVYRMTGRTRALLPAP